MAQKPGFFKKTGFSVAHQYERGYIDSFVLFFTRFIYLEREDGQLCRQIAGKSLVLQKTERSDIMLLSNLFKWRHGQAESSTQAAGAGMTRKLSLTEPLEDHLAD
ncbi:hypothetical protein [Kamptonema formosum]|uniref:hypothetical protein n=1 Tax=Kamptonema formosum TaxID=331992 RepID=UPI00034A5C70|nr:hypothetical protein [Oscillatoria sp. PCC 10802]